MTSQHLSIILEQAAKQFVAVGWHVFPVRDKQPLVTHGHNDAQCDAGVFNWDSPTNAIGVAAGPSELVVVDVDSPEAEILFREIVGEDPQCSLIAKTKRGRQYFYADPENQFRCKNGWREDIDIKAYGGYIVAPPSGGRVWEVKGRPTPPPKKLAMLLPQAEKANPFVADANDGTVQLLLKHGWTHVSENETNQYWKRPDKDADGHSATWNGDVFYVHSSNALPFQPEQGYNATQVAEVLEGPESAWFAQQVTNAWATDPETAFPLLAKATDFMRLKYRKLWKADGNTVASYDEIIKNIARRQKKQGKKPSGTLLQREYAGMFKGIRLEPRLNLCNKDLEINGAYLDESSWHHLIHSAAIWIEARERSMVESRLLAALHEEAGKNAYNPLKEYIEGCPKSYGTAELDKFLSCFTGKDEPDDHIRDRIRSWLVGCVAHLYEPGYQNPMLVFQDEGGTGKSYAPKWLASQVPSYFYKGCIDPGNKDHHILQSRTWLWEVEELEGTTSKKVLAALKGFLTAANSRVRAPYGRREVIRTAIANYVGTVNPEQFLVDDTGNRRFLVCFLNPINWSYSGTGETFPGMEYDPNRATTPEQIWADAKWLYDQGPKHWQLSAAQKELAEQAATQALDTASVDSVIWNYIELTPNPADLITLDDLVDMIRVEVRGIRASSLRKQISAKLKKAGRKRQRRRSPAKGANSKESYFQGIRPRPTRGEFDLGPL